MTLIDVYDELEEKGIRHYSGVYGFDGGADAATVEARGSHAIFFDIAAIRTERQEIATAIHELAHIEAGATIPIGASAWEVFKAERKATRYEILRLLPFDELRRVTRSGECRNNYEIAERFDVPEQLVAESLKFYDNRGEKW